MSEDGSEQPGGKGTEFADALDRIQERVRLASTADSTAVAGVHPDAERASGETDEETAERLAELRIEERELSRRRRQLHVRIDTLQAAPVPLNLTFSAQLQAFERAEVVVSANRRRLHREIDALSASIPTARPG